MFSDALSIALYPLLWAFGFVAEILSYAGALPLFFAVFAAGVVSRLIIRPLVGDKHESRSQSRSKGDAD